MSRIYRLSKAGTKLLYKVRHHRGHGVHSPFVFSFINQVIEEKTLYYAYDDIRSYLDNFPDSIFVENKINRLSFRVVNRFGSKNILELGAGDGINTLYITTASSEISCLSVELDPVKYSKAKKLYERWDRQISLCSNEFPVVNDKFDSVFINLRNYISDCSKLIPYLISIIKEDSFIFLDGIRTNRKHQMLWRKLINDDRIFVSLDLFEVGIIFFDKKYIKRNYKLSF